MCDLAGKLPWLQSDPSFVLYTSFKEAVIFQISVFLLFFFKLLLSWTDKCNMDPNSPEYVKIIIQWHFCHGETTAVSRVPARPVCSMINKGLSVIWHSNQCSQKKLIYLLFIIALHPSHLISLLQLLPLWSPICIFSPSSPHSLSQLSCVSHFLSQSHILPCFHTFFSHIHFRLVFYLTIVIFMPFFLKSFVSSSFFSVLFLCFFV